MNDFSSPADPIKVLFIDMDNTRVSAIETALKPEFNFSDIEIVNRLRKGIELLRETDFDAIYIHDEFEKADLDAFFNDLIQLKGKGENLCVLYKEKLAPNANRKELKTLGFATIISYACDKADKEELEKAIINHFQIKEIEKKTIEVNDKIDILLKEIDEAVQDIKRGAKPSLNKIPTSLIEMNTEFHQDVFEKYFEALSSTTENCEPPQQDILTIPEEILRKNLPHLSDETYKGVSRRVWKKMLGLYGKKASSELVDTEQGPSEETSEE